MEELEVEPVAHSTRLYHYIAHGLRLPYARMQLRNPHFYLMLLIEACLLSAAYVTALFLRFEFQFHESQMLEIKQILPWIVPLKLSVFFLFGLYDGMWRYTSLADHWRLAQGCVASSLLIASAIWYIYNFVGFSRAVLLLDGFVAFIYCGTFRIGVRTCFAAFGARRGRQALCLPWFRLRKSAPRKVLIIGAGRAGEKLFQEILNDPRLNYQVVGFLDDDPHKVGRVLRDVRVLGFVEDLPRVLEENEVHEVLISIPSATGVRMRRVVELCEQCGAPYKTIPAVGQIIEGQVILQQVRDVRYEDLLRREPVRLDATGIREYLAGRTVMVTGCGGSIGSELTRQLIRFAPGRLILVDAGEENLFNIQMELKHEKKYPDYHCILGRVQNRSLMEDVFGTYRPQVIFHAAAYKHVPMLERNPWEAVFNNVLGSWVVMELAAAHGADRFVLVSTDKAVRPTNVMGASKRLAEIGMQSLQGNSTRFMAVRFGNVVGSSGSVIPLFRRQIENGGPVTVTHPEVTRYFMTIPEATQLILQAGALGKGGEIFVLEMGTPVKITDLARDLIRLSGRSPDVDIEIVYSGLRPGEKLYEELITEGEDVVRTVHEKIMVLRSDGPHDGNGNGNGHGRRGPEEAHARFNRFLDELHPLALSQDAEGIKCKLKEFIPEYTPQDTECVLPGAFSQVNAPPAAIEEGDADSSQIVGVHPSTF
jgi:FlaA1/EpsC-like NDP-sugar epimerase